MIKYPGGKKTYKKPQNLGITSGRGMSLEEDINTTNEFYRIKDLAIVHKKPTPVQIVNVDYPSRSKAKITEAYFRQASTTDYQGVYKGCALDFEAKETKNKTLFPLALLHQHQYDHIKSVHKHGAIAFLIIRFNTLEKTYLVFAEDLIAYVEKDLSKSLPLKWIEAYGYLINGTFRNPCDYLSVIKEQCIKE